MPIVARLRNWLHDRILGAVLTTLTDHANRITTLEAHVGELSDKLKEFRAQADAETTRIGEVLADLQRRLDSGDANAVAQVSAEMSGVIDTLRALGTGDTADPLPDPNA
jgi:hypothetical protein